MVDPPPDFQDGPRPQPDSSEGDARLKNLRERYLGRHGTGPLAMAGAGLELGAGVVVLTLGGWWLDTTLCTLPTFVIGGLMIGMIGGLYNMWRRGRRFF